MSIRWITIVAMFMLVLGIVSSWATGTDYISARQPDLNGIASYSQVNSEQTFGRTEVPGPVSGYWTAIWNVLSMSANNPLAPSGSGWVLLAWLQNMWIILPVAFGIVLLFIALFKGALA